MIFPILAIAFYDPKLNFMLSNQSSKTDFHHKISNYQEHSSCDFADTDRIEETFDRYVYSLSFNLVIETLDILFLEMYDKSPGTVEVLILEGVWQNKTYSEIARENNYSSDYFTNVAAPKLFKKLSKLIECRITKKNCRSLVTKYVLKKISTNIESCLSKKTQCKESSNILSNYHFNFKQKQNFSFLKNAIFSSQTI